VITWRCATTCTIPLLMRYYQNIVLASETGNCDDKKQTSGTRHEKSRSNASWNLRVFGTKFTDANTVTESNAQLLTFVSCSQCFSIGVPRNLKVPRVAARGSAEPDRNWQRRNSQSQFYAVAAIPLFHSILATMNCTENSVLIYWFITESRMDTWIIA